MATTKQTHMIAGRMVEFQEKFSRLSNDDAQYVIQNAGEAIDLFVTAVTNRIQVAVQAAVSLLSAVICSFSVPATRKRFIAKEKFKVDASKKAKVKILHLSDNFQRWFLGKIEEPFAGSTIYGRKLEKDSVDRPILAELGGPEAAKTTLTELYVAMAAQAHGESGALLTNGRANIFYIEDINGLLRAVRVGWFGAGWRVRAYSVGGPDVWDADVRAFSRNYLIS